ncbi:MAG TPA: hypothetical protein VIA08_04550 [Nitrososphaeraceae archaeon]|jgi:hypothetical protein
MYSKNKSTDLAQQIMDFDSHDFAGITWADKSHLFGIASSRTLGEAYLVIHPELDLPQEDFEPTEEEVRVFEKIKKGEEKITRQSAEDLIKELNDMSDEQS